MMSRAVICVAVGCLAASVSYADNACDTSRQQFRDCERFVDSLRPDKPGQTRVFAFDGSEFTAGEVYWMRGQLRKAARLCARGGAADQVEAAKALEQVQNLVKSHHRCSYVGSR